MRKIPKRLILKKIQEVSLTPFCCGDGQTIPAWIEIEYMTQAVAAHGGMMRRLAGKPVNMGFLLGSRRYNCNVAEFAVDTKLSDLWKTKV